MTGPALATDADLEKIMTCERSWIDARRRRLGVEAEAASPERCGLALSGGGIRSATFSLGVLQALSRHRCLDRIDYLSTVSGGSYIGSFFGALYVPPAERFGNEPIDEDAFLADPLNCERGREAVMRLREFGRYLTPGGLSDTLFGMSLIARNWIAVHLVIGMVPLILFFGLQLIPTDAFVRLSGSPEGALQPGSSMLLLGALVSAVLAAALAAGYWFSPREAVATHRLERLLSLPLVATSAATAAVWVVVVRSRGLPATLTSPVGALLLVPALALLSYAITLARHGKAQPLDEKNVADKRAAATQAEDKVRAKMTRSLATANKFLIGFLAWFVIDTLGKSVGWSVVSAVQHFDEVQRRALNENFWASAIVFLDYFWPLLVVLAPLALTIWAHRGLRHGTGPGWLSRPAGQTFLGFSILFLWMVVWTAIAVQIAAFYGHDWLRCTLILVAMVVIAVVQCFLYGFLNLSSLVTLYAARLKRAYVGASNPSPQKGGYDIDRPGDLVPMPTYYGVEPAPGQPATLVQARPVHLINVTVAQTEPEGASHVVAYDRKGKPMHLSPAGIVFEAGGAGSVDHRAFKDAEDLSLSNWTAISGAAASTAIGSMTSLGLSVLAMMANVRLGYWWKHDTSAAKGKGLRSRRDTVLGYLYSEFSSSFDTSMDRQRRWYLTDGGHFENTGAYALLQRAVEFVVVCDNGADPDYRFDDVVRLIDRARTDLGAEITFLDRAALDDRLGWWGSIRQAFGTYEELGRPPRPEERTGPYATLARIRYARTEGGPKVGTLMLIKPRLNFSEPPELLAYRRREAGAAFPQQTTLDQFFDEEQWEAYRRFGEVVGDRLFGPAADAGPWSPGETLRGAQPARPHA